MEKKSGMLKSEKIGLFLCCVFCFLAHVVVINQFNGWFCTDTDGYWLHAATFTGHDWSGVASKVSMYYAWGYSVLLTIPMLLSDDILVMSRIVVVMNSILCALTIPLLYSIGKKVFVEVKSWVIMAAALITSLYPAYFINSAVALAELFIYFLYVLLIWLIVQYLETKKSCWAVLSSVCCGYLYVTHHRNLGMVVAFGIFVLFLFIKNRNWKELVAFVVPIVVMFGLEAVVNDWLTAREMAGGTYTSNTYASVGGKAFSLLSLKGILFAIQSALGEVWYLFAGTFTIAGCGIIAMIRQIFQKTEVSDKKIDDKKLFFAYLILNMILEIGVSVVFCTRMTNVQNRIDVVFYGRYFECTIVFLLFFGLIWLHDIRKAKEKEQDFKIIFLCMICLSLLVHCFTEEITGNAINYFSVAAVLFPFSYPNVEFSVLASSIFVVCVVLFLRKLLLCEEIGYRVFAGVLLAGCFLYVGYNGTINTSEIYIAEASPSSYPIYNEEFVVMNRCIGGLDLESLYICTENGYEAFSYQLFNPERKIMTVKSIEEIDETVCRYAMLPVDSLDEFEIEEVWMETPNYVLCKLK